MDGTIRTVVGRPDEECTSSSYPDCGDGGPAARALLGYAMSGMTLGPNGRLYVSDNYNMVIRRVAPPVAGVSLSDLLVPNVSGTKLFRFDRQGRHLSSLDTTVGVEVSSFSYDGNGQLTAIVDRDGNVTTIERDGNGQASAVQGPNGQRTIFTYDASGFLATVANPAGEQEQFSYTTSGLMTSHTDREGHLYTYAHDDMGRLLHDANPAGGWQTLSRTSLSDGYEVSRTTAMGRMTIFREEALPTGEHHRRVTYPDGSFTEVIRATDGTLEASHPGGTTVTTRPLPDARWGMQSPLQHTTVTTPGGLVLDRVESQTITLADPADPLGLQTMTRSLEVNGDLFEGAYDASGRQWSFTTPEGRNRTTTLDAVGRVTSGQVAGLYGVDLTRDGATDPHPGRLREVLVGGVLTASFDYDGEGRLHRVTGPMSTVTEVDHDSNGRPTALHLPGGRDVLLSYDRTDRVVTLTPPDRPAHTFTYDAANRLVSYVAPEASSGLGPDITSFHYNLDGQLMQVNLPTGDSVTMEYGANSGQLQQIVLPTGSFSFTYDNASRLASITDPGGGALAFSYDGHLRVGETWSGVVQGSVSREHDDYLRVSSSTVSANGIDSSVAFLRDDDGLLVGAGSLTLIRDAQHGAVVSTAVGDVVTSRFITTAGELQEIRSQFNGTDLYREEVVARDALGRITERTESIGGVTTDYGYGYDTAGRLTEVWINAALVAQYTYDLNGNRTSGPGASATQIDYDDQDRLRAYGDRAYSYFRNGTLESTTDTTLGTTLYDYDVLGNLLSVTLPGGELIEYVVDGRNRRVGKRVNGSLEWALLYKDRLNPVAMLDGNGNIISRFVYATRRHVPALMEQGGNLYRLVTDHLGTPHLVVNTATGAVVERLDFNAFGVLTSHAITPDISDYEAIPFGFAGGLHDPDTGLVRFGSRDYDPQIGRWTAKDPSMFRGRMTNIYLYAYGDPVNYRDPTGGIPILDRADELADLSSDEAIQIVVKNKLPDHYVDSLRHCIASCAVSTEYGSFVAEMLGHANEVFGSMRQGNWAAVWMDEYNNNCGRWVGDVASDIGECGMGCFHAQQMGLLIINEGQSLPPAYRREIVQFANDPSLMMELFGVDLPSGPWD